MNLVKYSLHNKPQMFSEQRKKLDEEEPRGSGGLHPSGREGCRQISRYLKVWCIAIGMRMGAEASCTIWQVCYSLLGEGALDDVGVIAILLQAGAVTYTHNYKWLYIQTLEHDHTDEIKV